MLSDVKQEEVTEFPSNIQYIFMYIAMHMML